MKSDIANTATNPHLIVKSSLVIIAYAVAATTIPKLLAIITQSHDSSHENDTLALFLPNNCADEADHIRLTQSEYQQ